MTIFFLLIVLHFISILLPVISILIRDQSKKAFLFWMFNLICPSINAQVLITDILVKNSRFCRLASLLFQSIGDETIVWNVFILIGHVLLSLALLIVIDSGLLRFSFSCLYSLSSHFDERRLDDDVLVERHRVLTQSNDDHLTVKDLVKFYPIRRVVSVNHLTFGVKRGEAFGLLGYNVSDERTDRDR